LLFVENKIIAMSHQFVKLTKILGFSQDVSGNAMARCGNSGHSIVLQTNFQSFYFAMSWYETGHQTPLNLRLFRANRPLAAFAQKPLSESQYF